MKWVARTALVLIACLLVALAAIVHVHAENRVWPIASHRPALLVVLATCCMWVIVAGFACLLVAWLWGEAGWGK